MAFSIAWMRSILRLPNSCLKWTSTENMWVDGGTKEMDLTHMRAIMSLGKWSISYSPEFVKQVSKAKTLKPSVQSACVDLPGVRVEDGEPLLAFLWGLAEKRGWHLRNGIGIQVAFNAKSFRTPEPRFSASQKPLRSSYARFNLDDARYEWRRLERAVRYSELPNQHALIDVAAPVLISMFHAEANAESSISDQQKNETNVNCTIDHG